MRLNFINRYFADTEVGAKFTLDADQPKKTMKEFKKELVDAKTELLNMQQQFGATSKQALDAAKKVAVLTDNLKDANETAKLFDPGNKFQVLGNSIRGLVGGFTALQGVLALAGVEGEELQKTLLKVQGALALTEGLNVIADVAKDFQRLGSVIVQTLGKNGAIGLAIAGVALLGAALIGVFDGPSKKIKELNNSLKELAKAEADARKEVYEIRNAFKQAELGIITKKEALDKYNNGLGKTIGFAKDLNEAEKLTGENAAAYIKVQGLKAQANYILGKSAELSGKAMIAEAELAKAAFDPRTAQGQFAGLFKQRAEQQKKDADDLLKLIDGINEKIAEASKGFKTTTSPTGTARTDKIKKDAEEEGRIVAAVEEEKLAQKTYFADRDFKIDTELATKKIDLSKTIADSAIAANEAQMKSAADLLAYEQYITNSRIEAAKAVGLALGALSELIGKQTAAGKALAIAQAVINTWLGVTEIIKTKSVLPEPMATISRIANIVAIVATGLNAVKNIAKAQVPGASSGGSIGSQSSAAPIQPRVPSATSTLLDQAQLNQIGNATARAFILESDITSSRERWRRINRAARI